MKVYDYKERPTEAYFLNREIFCKLFFLINEYILGTIPASESTEWISTLFLADQA